ncbi:MAG: ATP-binding protein [Mariprofundaceae bacterium]|nr:ATP-binding protein [Mariprofundaceae bacterium]
MTARKLKDLTIGTRLGLGFGIVFVLFCTLTLFAINRMEYLANKISLIHNHPLTVSNAVLKIDTHIVKMHRTMKDIVLDESAAEINKDSEFVDKHERETYAEFDIIDKSFLGNKALLEAAREAFVSWKPVRDEIIQLMRAGKRSAAIRIIKGKGARHAVKIENTMDALYAFAQGKADEFVASARDTTDQSIKTMYLLLFLVVVTVMIFTVYLTRSITRPVEALRAATLEIGKGKLDTPLNIDADGEMGELARSVHEMTVNLANVTASRDELNEEITERKQAEDELRRSEERIKLLLESTAEAIYGLDAEGKCTFANPACLKILGYESMDDVLGKNMHNLIHHTRPDGSPYPMHECHIYEAFQKGTGTHVDNEVLWRKDGTSFAGEYWSHPIHEDGKTIGSVVTFMDITERKGLEKARQKLMDNLEEKATEMERFVYTVSHDLKSPLITIQGFLGLLEKDALEGETKRIQGDISHIQKAARQMQELLADLLEISRIGRLVNTPERVNFNQLVQDVVELLDGQIKTCGVQIDVMPEMPTLYGDRKRLLEVVQNLIDNALKFMGEQTAPHIEIGYHLKKGENIYYIKDNGIGIEPRFHQKVFELFERLNPEIEGTGIGLAIVKRIIELEGGRMWIESEGKGRGCTFCFVLPDKHGRET